MEIKRKYIIIILVILILVMLMIIMGYILPKNNKSENESEFLQMNSDFRHDVSNYLSEEQQAIPMPDEVMIAENSYKFFGKYCNKVSSKEIQENWDNFARKVIPKYNQNIKKEDEIENYFKENSKEIYSETGINNYDDFYKIVVLIIDSSDSEKLQLEKMIISDIVTTDENYTYAELKCVYKGDININFNMKVFNEKNDDGVFIIYY